MYKKLIMVIAFGLTFFAPLNLFAWGRQGHQIVAQIAAQFLNDSIKQKVQKYLGKASFEDAATWMDESRSNDFYGYMRNWHYIDFEKNEHYKPSSERNALTVLYAAINDIKKGGPSNKNIKQDLFLIFHLVGDLHQPMHVGYSSDRGGNDIAVSYIYKSYNTNLHSVWDTEIIESEKITKDSCLNLYKSLTPTEIAEIKKLDEVQWMNESRSYLDSAYNFKNNFLDKNYVQNNKTIITKRLLLGGMRLAAILEELFKS